MLSFSIQHEYIFISIVLNPKHCFLFPISHLFYPIVLDMFLVLCMAQLVCARGYVLEALLDIFIFFPALYSIVGMRPWIWGNGQIVGSVCPQRSIRSGKNSRGSALCWGLFFRVHLCAFGPMYSSGSTSLCYISLFSGCWIIDYLTSGWHKVGDPGIRDPR